MSSRRNSALFVLLVLGALSLDPVHSFLQTEPFTPPPLSILPGASGHLLGAANGHQLVDGIGSGEDLDISRTKSLKLRDQVEAPPQAAADDDDDRGPKAGVPSTAPEQRGGDSAGIQVALINFVCWSIAAVGVMCLFYLLLRLSRRASAWAWGPSRTYPQPIFLVVPHEESGYEEVKSINGDDIEEALLPKRGDKLGMPSVVIYTPQPTPAGYSYAIFFKSPSDPNVKLVEVNT